jgi:hypothetical protein
MEKTEELLYLFKYESISNQSSSRVLLCGVCSCVSSRSPHVAVGLALGLLVLLDGLALLRSLLQVPWHHRLLSRSVPILGSVEDWSHVAKRGLELLPRALVELLPVEIFELLVLPQ